MAEERNGGAAGWIALLLGVVLILVIAYGVFANGGLAPAPAVQVEAPAPLPRPEINLPELPPLPEAPPHAEASAGAADDDAAAAP